MAQMDKIFFMLFRSIHLSNNSVQKNYANMSQRSDKLPADNMWTDEEFQDFLK